MVDIKGNVDWTVDETIQNPLQGSDHASLPTEQTPGTKQEENENANVEFKEIICPHNNIATAAMLGGIYEGEQVDQDVQGNESGKVFYVIIDYSFYQSYEIEKEVIRRRSEEIRWISE